MIRLALLVVPLLLAFGSPLAAQITDPKTTFTVMCVTEKSTGFKWRNGDWEYARFETGRRIVIEKLEPEPVADPTNPPRSGSCKESMESEQKEARHVERSGRAYGCYNVRDGGDEFSPFDSQVCEERWRRRDRQGVLLRATTCDDPFGRIVFATDGWFHRGIVHPMIAKYPKDGRKDALVLEVGKCAVLGK